MNTVEIYLSSKPLRYIALSVRYFHPDSVRREGKTQEMHPRRPAAATAMCWFYFWGLITILKCQKGWININLFLEVNWRVPAFIEHNWSRLLVQTQECRCPVTRLMSTLTRWFKALVFRECVVWWQAQRAGSVSNLLYSQRVQTGEVSEGSVSDEADLVVADKELLQLAQAHEASLFQTYQLIRAEVAKISGNTSDILHRPRQRRFGLVTCTRVCTNMRNMPHTHDLIRT